MKKGSNLTLPEGTNQITGQSDIHCSEYPPPRKRNRLARFQLPDAPLLTKLTSLATSHVHKVSTPTNLLSFLAQRPRTLRQQQHFSDGLKKTVGGTAAMRHADLDTM